MVKTMLPELGRGMEEHSGNFDGEGKQSPTEKPHCWRTQQRVGKAPEGPHSQLVSAEEKMSRTHPVAEAKG